MTPPKHVIFLLLQATETWLRLSRADRRHFHAEAFWAHCSDLLLIETDDLVTDSGVMEVLRDSPLVPTPSIRILQIIPSVEDGFRQFEERSAHAL
jgi:hypothetical protein